MRFFMAIDITEEGWDQTPEAFALTVQTEIDDAAMDLLDHITKEKARFPKYQELVAAHDEDVTGSS